MGLTLHRASESPRGLVKTQITALDLRVPSSVGLRWESFHFQQASRWCRCCWPTEHTEIHCSRLLVTFSVDLVSSLVSLQLKWEFLRVGAGFFFLFLFLSFFFLMSTFPASSKVVLTGGRPSINVYLNE